MKHQDLNTPNKQLAELMKNPGAANVTEVINLLKQQQGNQEVSYFAKPVVAQAPSLKMSAPPPARKKDIFSLMNNLLTQTTKPETFSDSSYNLFA